MAYMPGSLANAWASLVMDSVEPVRPVPVRVRVPFQQRPLDHCIPSSSSPCIHLRFCFGPHSRRSLVTKKSVLHGSSASHLTETLRSNCTMSQRKPYHRAFGAREAATTNNAANTSGQRHGAAAKVAGIVELLERILEHLSIEAVFGARTLSRTF